MINQVSYSRNNSLQSNVDSINCETYYFWFYIKGPGRKNIFPGLTL